MLRGDFLMTYDDDPFVRALAKRQGFDTCAVAMKNTHHARMTELLIGRNLDWMRRDRISNEEGEGHAANGPGDGASLVTTATEN